MINMQIEAMERLLKNIEAGKDSYYELVKESGNTGIMAHINYAVEKGYIVKGDPGSRGKIPLEVLDRGREFLRVVE